VGTLEIDAVYKVDLPKLDFAKVSFPTFPLPILFNAVCGISV